MTIQQLLEPIIEGGIHSTNFFNGRRLTAEDLLHEKKSNRAHERLLGQAIGEGVVHGLEVGLPDGLKTGGSKIEIQKGLAINRKGDVLYLPNKIPVPLVPPVEEEEFQTSFVNCEKSPTQYLTTNHGVYVLLITPASGLSGSAPMSSIPDDGSIIGCGKSDRVEGVQFRLVKMDLDGPAFAGLKEDTKAKLDEVSDKTDVASVSMFRNIVAHACFGTEEKEKFIVDPFGSNDFPSYGAIDKLRSLKDDAPNKITDCDVPIAIIRWTEQKIKFVDLWSVRRRPYELTPSNRWPTIASSRRLAEAEAMFFQFQEQIEQLFRNHTNPASISAQDYLSHLPPAGFLPIISSVYPLGLTLENFFSGTSYRQPVFTDGAQMQSLFTHSFEFPPIRTDSSELVWLYEVQQNRNLTEDRKSVPQQYIIFANGYMPFYGHAHYDLSRWDFSNFEPAVQGKSVTGG